jgi:hypothetical protein
MTGGSGGRCRLGGGCESVLLNSSLRVAKGDNFIRIKHKKIHPKTDGMKYTKSKQKREWVGR